MLVKHGPDRRESYRNDDMMQSPLVTQVLRVGRDGITFRHHFRLSCFQRHGV